MADEEIADLRGFSPRIMRLHPPNSSRRSRPRRGFLCLDCALHLITNRSTIYGSDHFQTAASSYPLGSTLNGALITEHELLMLGLMRYWTRRFSKTTRNMMWNNRAPQTPLQVDETNAKFFYGNQPWTCSYNTTSATAATAGADVNFNIADSNLFTNLVNNPQTTTMLPLFPEQGRLFSEEVNNVNNNGFQVQTGADDVTLMTVSEEGELDLELNLGWSK